MITIVSQPLDFVFCRNKTFIKVSTNNFSGQIGFKILCHVQEKTGVSTYVTRATLSGYIDGSNAVKFRIDSAVLPYATWATIALNSNVCAYGKTFRFRFVEYYEQAEHNPQNSDDLICVPFGKNYIHEQDSDLRISYFYNPSSSMKFLSNKANNSLIGLNTDVVLFAFIHSDHAHHVKMFADYKGITDSIQLVTDYPTNNDGKVLRHYFKLKDSVLQPLPGTEYAQIVLTIDGYPADGNILVLKTKTGNKEIRFKSTHVSGWIYNNIGGEDSYLDDWAIGNIQPFLVTLLGSDYNVTTVSGGSGSAIITITATAPGLASDLSIVSNDMSGFFYENSNTTGSTPLTDNEKLCISNLRFEVYDNTTLKCPAISFTINPFYNELFERSFIYKNTLGTFDFMHTYGKSKAKDMITDADALLYAENPQDTVVFNPELVNINAEWNTEITAQTGHTSIEDFNDFKQFMLSPQRYEVLNGKLLPIVLTSKEVDGLEDNYLVYNRTFKYKYSINDINY